MKKIYLSAEEKFLNLFMLRGMVLHNLFTNLYRFCTGL